MFLSSSPSPTLSGSSSTFHSRAYHASSRRNYSSNSPSPRISHAPQSPRFQAPLSAPRRTDGLPSSAHRKDGSVLDDTSLSSPPPPPAPPQPEKRSVDAGTQYTPPEYPPTYRPPPVKLAQASQTASAGPAIPNDLTQSSSSAAPQTTTAEAPESEQRVDPQKPKPTQPTTASTTTKHDTEDQGGRPSSMTSALADSLSRSSVADAGGQPSPSKKPRQQDPAVKVMPLKYENCDVKDLGVLISDMLMELVRLNDKIPLKDGQLTRFHSRAPPGISVKDYLNRLIVHATLSPPILLSMVYYVDRLCSLYPAFTISSLTVHRFLITAATVAAKGLSDSFWTNSTYARVGGVSTKELALLELEFLRRLEWRIVPKPEVLVDYYRGLVERGEGYMIEKEEEQSEASNEQPVSERDGTGV